MKASVLKIIIYLFILLAVVTSIKLIVPGPHELTDCLAMTNEPEAVTQSSYYFIGSSRIMRGINPEVLQVAFQTKRVYNAGIPGTTFLSSCMLAEHIIRKKGTKKVFIELSDLKLSIPPPFIEALQPTDFSLLSVDNKILGHFPLREQVHILSDASNYVFTSVSLNYEFKRVAGIEEVRLKPSGYDPADGNNYFSTSTFWVPEDLNLQSVRKKEVADCLRLIQYLNELARNNNAEVIFFLPPTSRSEQERALVASVYRALPEGCKVNYPESYFKTLAHAEYLLDDIHLNRKGADVFSREIRALVSK